VKIQDLILRIFANPVLMIYKKTSIAATVALKSLKHLTKHLSYADDV
jgi:hypothetical protein